MTIKWHTGLPKKSGMYLACYLIESDDPIITTLAYSAKYKQFNMRDRYSQEESDKLAIDFIDAWAERPSAEELRGEINGYELPD